MKESREYRLVAQYLAIPGMWETIQAISSHSAEYWITYYLLEAERLSSEGL